MVLTSSSLRKLRSTIGFKIIALDSLSEYVRPSVSLSDAIPDVSHLLLFMKLHNRFCLFVKSGQIISSI